MNDIDIADLITGIVIILSNILTGFVWYTIGKAKGE